MASTDPIKYKLAERIKARGITGIVYFHTDHFEPWRSFDGRPAMGPENAEGIELFAQAMQRIDFARRLTLFYKTPVNYALIEGRDSIYVPGDKIGFFVRSDEDRQVANAAIGWLARESAHEFQLHVHHEYFTYNKKSLTDPDIRAWLSTPEGRALDHDRFELSLRLYLQNLEEETGRKFPRWFFVHGHWALNASDTNDCCLTREIEILHRNGCLGDFTFPAGRKGVDPRYEAPFLVRPVDAEKGYDLPQAEPESAFGSGAKAAQKFFIWASRIKHASVSIDYTSPFVRRRSDNVERAALDIIDNCYLENGTLFIKTHAHAMHPSYFETSRSPVFPHQYPGTQTILSLIFDGGASVGVESRFLTASEVYDLIVAGPFQPALDLHPAVDLRAAGTAKSGKGRGWRGLLRGFGPWGGKKPGGSG